MLARSALLAGFALFVCASAYGVDFADPDWRWRLQGAAPALSFRVLDADRDGALTPAEACPNRLLADRFAAADIDRDGLLSPLEFNHAALKLSAGQQDESSPVSGTLGITAIEQSGRVVISGVGRGTPAAAAGLRPGDVVLRYEGEPIARPRDLYRRILDSVPGSVVGLEIRRDGEPRRIQVRVEQVDVTPRV